MSGAPQSPNAMSDGEFSAFLNDCRTGLASLQADFQRRVEGGGKWFYDLSDCTLRIGEQSFEITPIGTYSAEYRSWLWAWANDEFPSSAREASKLLQNLYTHTGFRVFISPGIGASEADAHDFVALAVHCLGATGFFRVPAEDGAPALFLAVQHGGDSR